MRLPLSFPLPAALLVLGTLLAQPAALADEPREAVAAARSAGGVLTRFFRDIESQESELQKALSTGNAPALDNLLAPAFSLQQAGHALQTAQDLQAAKPGLGSVTLLQLHEASASVLVAVLRTSRYGEALVTDVWQNTDGSGWRLRLRVIPVSRP